MRRRHDEDRFGLGRLRALLEDEDMLDTLVDTLVELAGEVSISELDTDTLHILRAILEAEIERDLD